MHVNRSRSVGLTVGLRTEQGEGSVRSRIVVMAKEAEPGRVKTRLCPPLAPSVAARCHEAFVQDTLARLGRAGLAVDAVLAIAPAVAAAPRLQALGEMHGWRSVDQGDGDLGARMRRLLQTGVGEGLRVVIVGSDTPDLPLRFIRSALEALVDEKIVLGPASDGGYYLVGCRDHVPDIFGPEMPWGGGTLWRETLARLRDEDATPALLPVWHDVDDWAALRALASRIGAPHGRTVGEDDEHPVATNRIIDELRRGGLDL